MAVSAVSAAIGSLTDSNFGESVQAGNIIEKSWFETIGDIAS